MPIGWAFFSFAIILLTFLLFGGYQSIENDIYNSRNQTLLLIITVILFLCDFTFTSNMRFLSIDHDLRVVETAEFGRTNDESLYLQ